MYQIMRNVMTPAQISMIGVLAAFILTFLGLKFPFPFLPVDQGRAYAVNGALSKGKTRGVGLTFVLCFVICTLIFTPFKMEYLIYCILLLSIMLSGYLDDASEKPWSDYKKGLIDLVLSVMAVWTFLSFNSNIIYFGNIEINIPVPLYFVLGVILIWVSINVTNCSDGVDGLCANICCVVILSFAVIFYGALENFVSISFMMIGVLLAYLYFNSSPSSMLMGDAGSRALGFYIAVLAMKTGHPFMYVILAFMLILDGGIGLVKIFLLRFLKIKILTNTRTPLHDHARKNKDWSDTQVVFRFTLWQMAFGVIGYFIQSWF